MYHSFLQWQTLEHLAEDIGNLDYDILMELFGILSDQFLERKNLSRWELQNITLQENCISIGQDLHDILTTTLTPLADRCREYNVISPYHARSLENYSNSLALVGESIRDFEYHILYDLFGLLSQKFKKDAVADRKRKRPQIAWQIDSIGSALENIRDTSITELLKIEQVF